MTLSEDKIIEALKTKTIGKDLHFFDSVTSTFDVCENTAVTNGSVICAKEQTNGRGRLGRDWVSPQGGIYFSVILEPDDKFDSLQIYTSLCAVAVQRAIEKHVPCFIKWPNDIVSQHGKKLCGILTRSKFEGGIAAFINVGIGINANTSVSSENLPYASSVKDEKGCGINENTLLCDVLYEIEKAIQTENAKSIVDAFSKKSITLGSMVRVLAPDSDGIIGKCISIDSDGCAIIEKDDKSTIRVNSGEVSVRGIYGENYV